MSTYVLYSVVAGVVATVWGFVSWLYMPWHTNNLSDFKDETHIASIISEVAPTKGVYSFPSIRGMKNAKGDTPYIIAAVTPRVDEVFNTFTLLKAVIANCIAASLFLLITSYTGNLTIVSFIAMWALLGGVSAYISHSQLYLWYGFPFTYCVVEVFESALTWSIAALSICYFVVK